MVQLAVQSSKYIMIFLFLIYTFLSFVVFRFIGKGKTEKTIYGFQRALLFLIHGDAYLVLYLTTENTQILGFYLMQVILFAAFIFMYHVFYKRASELLMNHMCMLLAISFIMLTRLDFDKAFRQFMFLLAGFVMIMLIPFIMQLGSGFRKWTWLYAAVGILVLLAVLVFGKVSDGAKINITIGPVTMQPSEFVKVLFIFFIASMLHYRSDFKQVLLTGGISAVFVLILVASKDLGGALLYFFTFLVMIYVASGKWYYFAGGLGATTVACFFGYQLFPHVQNRVIAWLDPLSVYENQGYQLSQSLFAIGTGGWFGLGLNQGLPKKIPVVEKDFIFSAISEEMGGFFAICLILVCISCFLMMFNISINMKDSFYKLVAVGLGSIYALQVFLTIGGGIKFIPSTGVTLPLVSYGGSSLLSTILIFGIVQALYVMQPEKSSQKGGTKKIENTRAKTNTKQKTGAKPKTDTKQKSKKEKLQ